MSGLVSFQEVDGLLGDFYTSPDRLVLLIEVAHAPDYERHVLILLSARVWSHLEVGHRLTAVVLLLVHVVDSLLNVLLKRGHGRRHAVFIRGLERSHLLVWQVLVWVKSQWSLFAEMIGALMLVHLFHIWIGMGVMRGQNLFALYSEPFGGLDVNLVLLFHRMDVVVGLRNVNLFFLTSAPPVGLK